MRRLPRFIRVGLFFIAFSIGFTPSPTRAVDATVTDCDNFTGTGTISQAVADANSGGGTITFACSGTIIFADRLVITANVVINANGNTVIFDGGGSTRLFWVDGVSLELNGFTLQNGSGAGDAGAIVNSLGTVTINNSTFISNSAVNVGGAIYNGNGIATINNSTFMGNSAVSGGAIYSWMGTVTISNSTFTNNSGSVEAGAVINNGGTMTIINSTFTDNSAPTGGAIRTGGGALFSQDSHYDNNTCDGTITDNGGNTRNTAVTSAGCPGTDSIALDVSALACNGDDAVFTINNGDANFDVTGTGAGLDILDSPAGLITLPGPATWTNIIVTERRGEREFVPLGGISCPEAVIIPPSEPVAPIAPAVAVLGCALDSADGLEIANAPDDTYCRVLMRNGGVVSYSGAIPAELIGLGVILAVDVYRLEGGMSVNTFPNYARVCLVGAGRLFYMDSRNAPRGIIELATEIEGSLTCGWIPAPGTLILTN